MKELTCIVCPVGCHLSVDESLKVVGNRCPRGEKYAIVERTSPKRMITTTVRTTFEDCPRLSVKTKEPVPKSLMFDILATLEGIVVEKNVKIGDVIVADACHTGVDIIATKSISSQGVNL
ncbi:DUF1667 domain-containing protein [Paracholeplasma manati]|uniref:DUF1667 domain-containing protein n=1 Tax=Paracholeplasma manati TaxID=591373 RepID=UPI0024087C18|nr:DUF1667 domain-containing protein [Paracholeplasma manati]MDG0889552.1 DUF1667 domain-containing protein [Paracholeplasma manati]